MNYYTGDDIVEGTDIQWNDEEGVSVYETRHGTFGLYFWADERFSAIELNTLEEAQEWAEKTTGFFKAAEASAMSKGLVGVG